MVRFFSRCLPIICMPRKKRQSFPICEQEIAKTKHQGEINKLFVRRVESIRVTHQGTGIKRLPLQTIAERRSEHKKTKSKAAHRNHEKIVKPDDTEFDCETHISDRQSTHKHRIRTKKASVTNKEKLDASPQSRSCTPLEKLLSINKKDKLPSSAPSCVVDIDKYKQDDTTSTISSGSSISSDWSTSTYPDSQSSEKSDQPIQRRQSLPVTHPSNISHQRKHQSCLENFYLGKEFVRPQLSSSQTKVSIPKIKEEQNKMKTTPPQKQQSSMKNRNDMKPPIKSKQVLQNVRKMINDQSIQDQHFNDTRQRESVRL